MRNLKSIYIIFFVCLFIFGGLLVGNREAGKINIGLKPTLTAEQVIRVIDGDTIKVLINNKEETIRLIGIDAPETVDPRKTVECFGKKASDKAKEILTAKPITLESDPTQGDRDKYNRLLRYVFLNDLNFNKFMISSGYAHEYTYQNNPYRYQAEFKNAQRTAREENKGLWNGSICNS